MYHLGKECQIVRRPLYHGSTTAQTALYCRAGRAEGPKGTSCRREDPCFPSDRNRPTGERSGARKALDRFFCVRSVAMEHRKPSPVPWDERQTRRLCAKKKNAGLGITELEYSELTYCFENRKIRKILLTPLHGGDILFNVAARDKRSCEDTGFPWSPEKEDILNQISDNQIEMQP